MDVHAVAHTIGIGHRREDHAMAQPMRGRARHLAGDHRVIGGGQRRLRGNRDLELARRRIRRERCPDRAGRAQRGDEGLAETALAAKGTERVGVARPVRCRYRRIPVRRRRPGVGRPSPPARATARRRKSRGQHSQAVPSVCRMSPRKKCSIAEPSSKSTRTSAAGSGTIIKSPAVPNGVSQIGPNGDIIRLLPVQPTPFVRRAGSSRAGNPLPRTRPEMSQVATKTSSSRIMFRQDRRAAARSAIRCEQSQRGRPSCMSFPLAAVKSFGEDGSNSQFDYGGELCRSRRFVELRSIMKSLGDARSMGGAAAGRPPWPSRRAAARREARRGRQSGVDLRSA